MEYLIGSYIIYHLVGNDVVLEILLYTTIMIELSKTYTSDYHLSHSGDDEQPFDWPNVYARYLRSQTWHESFIADPRGEKYGILKTPGEYRLLQEGKFARTVRFMEFLERPQDAFRSIHVAGTGGKGSTTTMIEALLRKAGVRTGLHVSPYFQIPNETLVVNGVMASPSEYSQGVDKLRVLHGVYTREHPDDQPLYGEIRVALTTQHFRDRRIEWAAVETGMGGEIRSNEYITP